MNRVINGKIKATLQKAEKSQTISERQIDAQNKVASVEIPRCLVY